MNKVHPLQNIRMEDYNYPLPDERIAKYPLEQRDQSKLLVYKGSQVSHRQFTDLPEILPPGSFLFFNNTRVIPARLHFRKATGALIEIFLLHPVAPSNIASITMAAKGSAVFECLVGNLKRWKENEILTHSIAINGIETTIEARLQNREPLHIELQWQPATHTFSELLEAIGQIPIPPYLHREATDKDRETYQTVYALNDGSVAAPTAGLHFTENILNQLKEKDINADFITLHVGAGTFQPVKAENLAEHPMHQEQIVFSRENVLNILQHHQHAIAVGTTSARALESLYWFGVLQVQNKSADFFIDKLLPYSELKPVSPQESLEAVLDYMQQHQLKQLVGETELLIAPGYDFKICKGLVTNFHQPGSTLLLLVDAFVKGNWKTIYNDALTNNYRFLSYGDSSVLLPGE